MCIFSLSETLTTANQKFLSPKCTRKKNNNNKKKIVRLLNIAGKHYLHGVIILN